MFLAAGVKSTNGVIALSGLHAARVTSPQPQMSIANLETHYFIAFICRTEFPAIFFTAITNFTDLGIVRME
jgi:hypothetical protein